MLRVPATDPSASSSASSSSSPPADIKKKLVGGNWCGSPATTACSARINAANGIRWRDLRRLVEDDNVEQTLRREQL